MREEFSSPLRSGGRTLVPRVSTVVSSLTTSEVFLTFEGGGDAGSPPLLCSDQV